MVLGGAITSEPNHVFLRKSFVLEERLHLPRATITGPNGTLFVSLLHVTRIILLVYLLTTTADACTPEPLHARMQFLHAVIQNKWFLMVYWRTWWI